VADSEGVLVPHVEIFSNFAKLLVLQIYCNIYMYICDIYVVMVSSVNKLFVNLAILPPPLLCKEQKSLKHLNDVDWTDQ